MSERKIIVGQKYKHFKGNICKVIDIVYDSESNNKEVFDKIVIYEAMTGKFASLKRARPYDMFASEVDHEKYPDVEQKWRFEEWNGDDKAV